MVAGLGSIPPASALNYVPWAIVGFIFQFVIRRWHFSFWAKYNCMEFHLVLPGRRLTLALNQMSCLPLSMAALLSVSCLCTFGKHLSFNFELRVITRIYYSLEFPLAGTIGANTIQQWWGNRVFKETADWQYVPLKTVSPGNPFG
jgi:hypothetical protein